MKSGSRTSEFWLIAAVAIFALLVAKGWLTPAKVQTATEQVQQVAGEIPALIAAVKGLLESLAPLAALAGLAWAYLKRRSQLKSEAIAANFERWQAEKAKWNHDSAERLRAHLAARKSPEAGK